MKMEQIAELITKAFPDDFPNVYLRDVCDLPNTFPFPKFVMGCTSKQLYWQLSDILSLGEPSATIVLNKKLCDEVTLHGPKWVTLLSTTLHELSHCLVNGSVAAEPLPGRPSAIQTFRSFTSVFDSLKTNETLWKTADLMKSHHLGFIRGICHLQYRIGRQLPSTILTVNAIHETAAFGLSPTHDYGNAFAGETLAAAEANVSVSQVLKRPVPTAAKRLWESDLALCFDKMKFQ
jgi:hypothetical protein